MKIFCQIWQCVNLGLLLIWGVSGVYLEEMIELSGLVELSVIELTSADCIAGHQVPIFSYFSQHTPIFPIF